MCQSCGKIPIPCHILCSIQRPCVTNGQDQSKHMEQSRPSEHFCGVGGTCTCVCVVCGWCVCTSTEVWYREGDSGKHLQWDTTCPSLIIRSETIRPWGMEVHTFNLTLGRLRQDTEQLAGNEKSHLGGQWGSFFKSWMMVHMLVIWLSKSTLSSPQRSGNSILHLHKVINNTYPTHSEVYQLVRGGGVVWTHMEARSELLLKSQKQQVKTELVPNDSF